MVNTATQFTPVVLLVAAVAISSWFWGLGAGIAATLLGAAALDYFFASPAFAWNLRPRVIAEVLVFALVGALITIFNGILRAARRQAEAASTEAQRLARQLSTILEEIPSGIIVLDRSGRSVFMNRTGREISGAAPDPERAVASQAHDYQLRDPHTGRPLEPSETPVARSLHGERVERFEYVFRPLESDQELWVSVNSVPLLGADGRPDGAVAVFSDVTQERQLTAVLERSEKRFHLLADAGKELSASLDQDEIFQVVARLVVPDLADWLVVDLFDVAGLQHRLAMVHRDPAKVQAVEALNERYGLNSLQIESLAHILQEHQPLLYRTIPEDVLRAYARDEEHLSALLALGLRSALALPLFAHSRLLGVMFLLTAESGREYDKDDLALGEELAGRVAMAVDNARLFRELQQTLETREDFLAALAHDLNNPLTAIRLRAQVLRRRASDQMAADLEDIVDTTRRMGDMVRELLDIAALEMGQTLELRREPVDLVHLAQQIGREHEQADGSHALVVQAETPQLVGEWDPTRLTRVLTNLLSNATKYSPEGSDVWVRLRSETDHQGREWAVIEVQDQGIGIPEADMARVFERFHRASNVRGKVPGTGTGLSSVRQLVKLHGGTVSVKSQEGLGSTFTVRLPTTPSEVSESQDSNII